MYAIFRDRGRQYKARIGEKLDIDLLAGATDGATVQFTEVLLTSSEDGKVKVGTPSVAGGQVTAKVVQADRKAPKIEVFHFRAKKDSMNKKGHRQRHTRVEVQSIEGGA